ncbi:YlxR family protein [Desulfarculales bacterium]
MARVQSAEPWRTCRACGAKKPQAQLLCLALIDGRVEPDPRRRLPGRGAYICRSQDCARRLVAKRARQRIFGATLGEQAWAEFLMRREISSLPAQEETS